MFSKMILPTLGGTPAVWNTCLVFFQAALLCGYVYAHAQSRLALRRQLVLHSGLLVCCFIFLPIQMPHGWAPPVDTNPAPWLLLLLAVALGAPFVLLSASAPLMQTWFSRSGDEQSKDPYFLYVASNVGSLIGLFGYPAVIEPNLSLVGQSLAWSFGYALLVLLIVVAAAQLWRNSADNLVESPAISPGITWPRRLKWLILSAVPSSLLQSVTTYMTTDLAPVPLLWMAPLSVYFLSFVLVFSRKEVLSHRLMVMLLPIILIGLAFSDFWLNETDVLKMFPLALAALFGVAMVLHGELVRSRPPADRLTEFYLWIAAGGVLGGILSALVAPLVFTSLLEYPIVLVLAAMLIPGADSEPRARVSVRGVLIPAGVLLVGGALMLANRWWSFYLTQQSVAIVGTLLAIAVYLSRKRPIGFGLGLASFLLVGFLVTHFDSNTIHRARGFFGALRIDLETQRGAITLFHGRTSHGRQSLDPQRKQEPTAYYHRGGPLGQVFDSLPREPGGRKVAVIGLGTGTMAAYAGPGDHWTFYEINPDITGIARDIRYFSYLRDCRAKVDIVLGDGRLSMEKTPDGYFDLIVLDAFSSDSVPIHLLTREALDLYLKKLRPDGLIAFHISNQYLKLDRVLANLCRSHGVPGYRAVQILNEAQERASLGSSSAWGVVAHDDRALARIAGRSGWRRLDGDHNKKPWTDSYSSLLAYLNIRL
jgi:hypothetical protein